MLKVGDIVNIKKDLIVGEKYGDLILSGSIKNFEGQKVIIDRIIYNSLNPDKIDYIVGVVYDRCWFFPWEMFEESFQNSEELFDNKFSFTDLIKQIRKIINNENLEIDIFTNEICFCLYEVKLPIIYEIDKDVIYLDCNLIDSKLQVEELDQIKQIVGLLKENKTILKNILKIEK